MAPTDFQHLLAQLQYEFNTLQEENFALKAKLQAGLSGQLPFTLGVHSKFGEQTDVTESLPQTPRDLAALTDGDGLNVPQSPRQPEWIRVPDIKPQSVVEITDDVMLIDGVDGASDSEKDQRDSHKVVVYGAGSALAEEAEHTASLTTDFSIPSSGLNVRREMSKTGLLWHYASVLHRSSQLGNAIVETTTYRLCVAVFIVFDCAMIMWNCHYYSRDEAPLGPRIVTVTICTFFITDAILRATYYLRISSGLHRGWRDAFDFLCLAIMIFDEICLMVNGVTFKVSWASLMRGFRVLRLFYACRYIVKSIGASQFLREFDWLLNALMSASGWRTVLCVLFYIAIAFAICSVALTDGALYLECESIDAADGNRLCKHFGTLRTTFITLFKVTYGGILWGDILDSLDELSTFYALLFALFLLSYSILLVNTGVGAILRICQDSTDQQKHMDGLRKEGQKLEQEVRLMEQLFMEIDINDNGAISRTEFELALKDPHMTSTLSVLKLHIFDLNAIFPLFDLNGSGEISLDEWVLGCMKMKGPARALDVHLLQSAIDEVREEIRGSQAARKNRSVHSQGSLEVGGKPESRFGHVASPNMGHHFSHHKSLGTIAKLKTLGFEGEDFLQHQSISKSDMRAMALRELKRIPGLIKDALLDGGWVDMQSKSSLTRDDVNLYHFNHYYMCAKTTPNGITLEGLDQAFYGVGDEVVQYDPEKRGATPLATGIVLADSTDGNIRIEVKQGHFKSETHPVQVNGEIRGVPRNVIAPGAISFKEHISSEALKPRWFCSHWWGEKIVHFVKCCEEHAWRRRLGPVEAAYWVCAYANRQYDISVEISDDPTTSSFCKAMELAEGVLLFLDNNATPFTRIWCCFEMYLTIMSGTKALDIVTIREHRGSEVAILLSDGQLPCETQMAKTERERHFPLHLLVHGMRADLREGQATVASDRDKILLAINNQSLETNAAIEQANGALNAVFAQVAWVHALHKRVNLEDFNPPNGLSLPKILSRDTRRRLAFSFEMCPEVSNADLLLFARGLSPSYTDLHLSFGNCTQITDRGIRDLSEHLPKHIETCRLDFVGCSSITSKGLASLAQGLPHGILNLRLDFACCPEIDMVGIKLLSEHLPTSIKKFYATFPGTQVDRNFRSLGELQAVCGRPMLDRAKSRLAFLTGRKKGQNHKQSSQALAEAQGSDPEQSDHFILHQC